MPQVRAPEIDLTQVLQQVAREKNIEMDRWIAALEDAMASAAKKQHRIKEPVRSTFDPESGKFEAFIVKQSDSNKVVVKSAVKKATFDIVISGQTAAGLAVSIK